VVVVATPISLFALRLWPMRDTEPVAVPGTDKPVYRVVGAVLMSTVARLAVPACAMGV